MLLLLLGSTVARAAGGEAVNRLVAAGELDKAQERCDKALEMAPVAADLAEACGALAIQQAEHATSKIAAYQRIVGNWPGTAAAAEAQAKASQLALTAAGGNVEKLEAVAREWSRTPAAAEALDRAVASLVKSGRADLLLAYAERHMDDSGERARTQAYAVAWITAEKADSAASWATLLEQTPDHPRAETARQRKHDAQLVEARAADTCAAWTALEPTDHPSLALIHAEADRACLAEAETVGTSAAFASLLAARPSSSLRDLADGRRRALLLDETAARGASALVELALREPSLAVDARRRAMGLLYTVEATIADGRPDQPGSRVRLRTDGAHVLDPWPGTVVVTPTAGAPAFTARLVVLGSDGVSRALSTWADELRGAGLTELVGVDLADHGQRSGVGWSSPLPPGRCGREVDLAVEVTVGGVAARWPFTFSTPCSDVARWLVTTSTVSLNRSNARFGGAESCRAGRFGDAACTMVGAHLAEVTVPGEAAARWRPAWQARMVGAPDGLARIGGGVLLGDLGTELRFQHGLLTAVRHIFSTTADYPWSYAALTRAVREIDPGWVPAGTFPTDGQLPPSLAVACQAPLRVDGAWTWGCGRWTASIRASGRSRLTTAPRAPERAAHVAPPLSAVDLAGLAAGRFPAGARPAPATASTPPPELTEIVRFALPVPGPSDVAAVSLDLDADGHDELIEAACLRAPLMGCTLAVLRRLGATDDLWFVPLPGTTLPTLSTLHRLEDDYLRVDHAGGVGLLRWAGDGPTLDRTPG